MKRYIGVLLVLAVLASGCSNGQPTPESISEGDPPKAEQPAAPEEAPEQSADADTKAKVESLYSAEFLNKAYAMNYTDKQLLMLNESEVPEDTILNLTKHIDYDVDALTSPDGRYELGGYYVNGGGEGLLLCMYIMDVDSGKVTILPDWQNGYSTFAFLDNQRLMAAIAQVGGADYGAGVRFYNVSSPQQPYAQWELAPAEIDPNSKTEKQLKGAYNIKGKEQIIAAWCELPTEWGGWAQSDNEETYKFTILDYSGKVIDEIDTGVPIVNSNVGIDYPNFDKPNAMLPPKEGIVYFDIKGETVYTLDLETKEVSKVEI